MICTFHIVETVTADHCKNGGTLNPCQHGGSHVDYDENGDRICMCMPGYSGDLCESPGKTIKAFNRFFDQYVNKKNLNTYLIHIINFVILK